MTDTKETAKAGAVLDAEGHFHVEDAPIDLSEYLIEDWISLGFFWLLGPCVFYQFFTRYVLNDSAAWTEEIARYLLICTVFIAIAAVGPPHAAHSRRLPVSPDPAQGGPRAVHAGRRDPDLVFRHRGGPHDPR